MQFTISVYDKDSKCKVCGAHMSEYHKKGCEVGALHKELKELRAKAGSFCIACCDECKHGNCRELCNKCNHTNH